MLTNEQVRELISELKGRGHDVSMRDISYVVLCRIYEDHKLAFNTLFNTSSDLPFSVYNNCEKIVEIENYLVDIGAFNEKIVETKKEEGSISFDELKHGLIDDMNALIALRDSVDEEGNPTLEPKEMATVVGRIADIRVKLTEKYGATQKEENHRVVVLSKYTNVCPYCHKEF